MSECRRAQDAKRDIPVPLSPGVRRQPLLGPGRPAPGHGTVGTRAPTPAGDYQPSLRAPWPAAEVPNSANQRISSAFAMILAIDTETPAAEILSECAPEIGEGVFGPLGRGLVATGRCFGQMRAIDPGDGGCGHAEIRVRACEKTSRPMRGAGVGRKIAPSN